MRECARKRQGHGLAPAATGRKQGIELRFPGTYGVVRIAIATSMNHADERIIKGGLTGQGSFIGSGQPISSRIGVGSLTRWVGRPLGA